MENAVVAWLTYRLRAVLRLRRWSLIALAVFVALVGGTVLAAAAGARRAATAGDRPRLRMRVVGVVRGSQDLAARSKDPTFTILPHAFYEKYRDRVAMVEGNYMVRLRSGGAAGASPRFDRELRALYAGGSVPGVDPGTNSARFFGQSTKVQAVGLAAFGGVFLL